MKKTKYPKSVSQKDEIDRKAYKLAQSVIINLLRKACNDLRGDLRDTFNKMVDKIEQGEMQ